MNVLLTAAGRRTYLVRYFQDALRGDGLLVAANSDADAPAMAFADRAVVVPPSWHVEYPEVILDLCQRHDVGLLSSCHDLDTYALASVRETFRARGVVPILPDVEWARLCLDKYASGERLRAEGLGAPAATLSLKEAQRALVAGQWNFPLVVKARLGFGSQSLHVCRDLPELTWAYHRARAELSAGVAEKFMSLHDDERVLIQEAAEGPELRLNLVHDLNGCYAAHFACEVHAMRAGETDSATTLRPDVLGDLPQRLSALTGHVGIWGVDVMMDRGCPKIIDLNPRFTGEYPFFQLAGANVPAALLAWARGAAPASQWLTPEVGVRGFKDLVPVRLSGRPSE